MGDNKKEPKDLIDLLADVIIMCGKTLKLMTYTVLRIEERYNLDEFFKNAGLVNKANEYPIQNKIITEGDTDSYYMSIPDGISTNDFSKYKQSLEEKYNKDVEIQYADKSVIIKLSKIKEDLNE